MTDHEMASVFEVLMALFPTMGKQIEADSGELTNIWRSIFRFAYQRKAIEALRFHAENKTTLPKPAEIKAWLYKNGGMESRPVYQRVASEQDHAAHIARMNKAIAFLEQFGPQVLECGRQVHLRLSEPAVVKEYADVPAHEMFMRNPESRLGVAYGIRIAIAHASALGFRIGRDAGGRKCLVRDSDEPLNDRRPWIKCLEVRPAVADPDGHY